LKEKRQLAASQAKATESTVKQVKQTASTPATNGASSAINAVKPATPNKGNGGPRFRVNTPRPLNHRGPGFVGPGMGFGYGNFNNGFNNHPLFNNGFGNGFASQQFGNGSFGPGGWGGNNDFHRNRPARKFF
jgi:hypothetical protein